MERAERIASDVMVALFSAIDKHGPMHSPHEGYAVIKEELDELWELVRGDNAVGASAEDECLHIAAMAMRYILDLT